MELKRILLLIILLWGFSDDSFAQFDLNAYLASARSDLSLDPTQAKLDFLNDNNFNGPLINRLEFRVGSEDLNWSIDDYRLRITPGNPAELKANKRYYDKQVALLNTEYIDKLNDALNERYTLAIEHIFAYKKKTTLEKQLDINRKLIETVSKSTGKYMMDLGDLIDAESDELDIKISIQNSEIYMDEVEYLMKEMYEYAGEVDWGKDELMDTQDILNLFSEMRLAPSGEHIDLVKLDQRNALQAERFSVEKSESIRNIGYFQVGYDANRGNEPSDGIGYQVGVRIPIVNPDKPQLNRRKLALMDDESLMEEKRDEIRRDLELAVLRIDHYANQFHEINDKIEKINQQNFLNLQSPDKSIKISDLIKLNEFNIDLIEKKNQVEKRIYMTYIEYLNLNGKLTELPMRNFLSKDLSEF